MKGEDNSGSIIWSWVLLAVGFYMAYMVAIGLISGEVLAIGAKNMSPDYVAKDESPVFYWVSIFAYASTSIWLIYSTCNKILRR